MTGTSTTTLNQGPNSGDSPARDARGRLLPGHTMGRPVGSKNRRGAAEIERLHDRSAAAWAVVDARLAQGCVKTSLYLLSRLLPDSRTTELEGTDAAALVAAIATGDVTSGEAAKIAGVIKALSDSEELRELRDRLDQLETILAARADSRICRN